MNGQENPVGGWVKADSLPTSLRLCLVCDAEGGQGNTPIMTLPAASHLARAPDIWLPMLTRLERDRR
jgi:hypothetical protein